MEKFEYEKAGENAQPGVKHDIETWRELPDRVKDRVPLLYYLLGSGTPPYKMSKTDSLYVDESTTENQTCANCEFAYKKVVRDRYICSQIRGPIKPKGWCKLWKKGEK